MFAARLTHISFALALAVCANLSAQLAPTAPHSPIPNGKTHVLALLKTQIQPDISSADQALVAGHLSALGAAGLKRYTAVNAVSAILPTLNLDSLSSDPAIAHIWQFDADPARHPWLDLLNRIDRAATSSAASVVSASMSDGAYPDEQFAELIDRLLDRYQLTLVLQGSPGEQANAITLADPSAANADLQKPDFVTTNSTPALQALASLNQSGVTHPLARKALLINSAASTAWSPENGWGAISPEGNANAACTDLDQKAGPNPPPSPCFIASTTDTRYYQTTSTVPAKLTLVWNRSVAADGTLLSPNFELHVYDRSRNELASAVSVSGNVLQLTAASDSGLVIKVVSHGATDGSSRPARFALASSVQLQAITDACASLQVSSTSFTLPPQGGTVDLSVTAPSTCYWELLVLSNQGVVSAGPAGRTSGPGNLTIPLTAIPNTLGMTETETMEIVDYATGYLVIPTITFTQGPASACTYTTSASGSLSFSYSGGSGGINVTASPGNCASAITGGASWLSFTGNVTSGTGNWTPAFTAASNVTLNGSSSTRTASLTVSASNTGSGTPFSQSFSVTQAGLACTFTPPSTPFTIPAAGIPQSKPQSFAVSVSSPGCQWTASSGASGLTVVNSGVVQTGATSYTVQYWAQPNSGTGTAVSIAVGSGVYNGYYVGDGTITITTSDTDVASKDTVPIKWTFSGGNTARGDKVKVTISSKGNQVSRDTDNKQQGPGLEILALPARGALQSYDITVDDTTANVTGYKTVTLYYPLINVTYPPAGTNVESRNNPDPVTWAVQPAGAPSIGTVDILLVGPSTSTKMNSAPVDAGAGKYAITAANVADAIPGTPYTIKVVSHTRPNDWFGVSGSFHFNGLKIIAPKLNNTVVNNSSLDITYTYSGNGTVLTLSLQTGGNSVASMNFPLGNAVSKTVTLPVNKAIIGDATIKAQTDKNESDSVEIGLAGILLTPIQPVKAGRQSLTVSWTEQGFDLENLNIKVLYPVSPAAPAAPRNTVISGSEEGDVKSHQFKSVNLANPGTYTVQIETKKDNQTYTVQTDLVVHP